MERGGSYKVWPKRMIKVCWHSKCGARAQSLSYSGPCAQVRKEVSSPGLAHFHHNQIVSACTSRLLTGRHNVQKRRLSHLNFSMFRNSKNCHICWFYGHWCYFIWTPHDSHCSQEAIHYSYIVKQDCAIAYWYRDFSNYSISFITK